MKHPRRGTGVQVQAAAVRHERLSLRLPVRPESIGIGRRAAAQFGEEAGSDPQTLWRIRLAVSESISNVVLQAHPAENGETPHFVLLAESDGGSVRFTVSDEGSGTDARQDSPGMGLGLALLANSCDELGLDTGPGGGTAVRMTFLR